MRTDWKIFLDSDGVVCSFEQAIADFAKLEFHKLQKKDVWYHVGMMDKQKAFYEHLPKMEDADTLVEYVRKHFHHVSILTACGYTPKNAAQQKRDWYAREYPGLVVHTVAKSPDKAAHAAHNHILIDDREKSIAPWREAGGIGILHVNALDTIEQLNYITEQPVGE